MRKPKPSSMTISLGATIAMWSATRDEKATIEIYRNQELYELPDDLRGRLQAAIMNKCAGHKKQGPQEV